MQDAGERSRRTVYSGVSEGGTSWPRYGYRRARRWGAAGGRVLEVASVQGGVAAEVGRQGWVRARAGTGTE